MPRRSRARQQAKTSHSAVVGAGSPLDLSARRGPPPGAGAWRALTCNRVVLIASEVCIAFCPGVVHGTCLPSQLGCGATREASPGTVTPWPEDQHGDLWRSRSPTRACSNVSAT